PLGARMPRTVLGGTCRSTPCSASTFPNRFARLSTTIAASVMERAILPTTSTPPPSHPAPSFGSEPVRHADPPLAHVAGPSYFRGDRVRASNSSKRRNLSWAGAGRPGSTPAEARGSVAADRRHDPLLARLEPH